MGQEPGGLSDCLWGPGVWKGQEGLEADKPPPEIWGRAVLPAGLLLTFLGGWRREGKAAPSCGEGLGGEAGGSRRRE